MKVIVLCITAFISQWSYASLGQEGKCGGKFMELSLLRYRAQRLLHERFSWPMNEEIRLLQEYQFNCSSVNITSLFLGIKLHYQNVFRKYFPSVQVFRLNGIDNQYDLVAGSERFIYYSTSNISTNGVFEYPLAPPISVIRGDILAVSQPGNNSVVKVLIAGKSRNSFFSQKFSFGIKTLELHNISIERQVVLVYPVTDKYCVYSPNLVDASIITNIALQVIKLRPLYDKSQYLYPEMTFSCNGSVTKWIYVATYDRNSNRIKKDLPELQIWRQQSPHNYTKIKSSFVDGSTMIDANLFEFIPRPPLQFQKDDIFGIYVPNQNKTALLLYMQILSGPKNVIATSNETYVRVDFPLITAVLSISTTSSMYLTSVTALTSVTVLTSSDAVTSMTSSVMMSHKTVDIISSVGVNSTVISGPASNRFITFEFIFVLASIFSAFTVTLVAVIIVCYCCCRRKRNNFGNENNKPEPIYDEIYYRELMTRASELQDHKYSPSQMFVTSNVAYGASHSQEIDDNYI